MMTDGNEWLAAYMRLQSRRKKISCPRLMARFVNCLIPIIDKGIKKLLGQEKVPHRTAVDKCNHTQRKER
jgi:hypothetical protein